MFHLFSYSDSSRIESHKEKTKDLAPVRFEPDFVYVPFSDTDFLLAKIGNPVKKGTLLASDKENGFPIYSSVSGTIRSIGKLRFSDGMIHDCLIIENDRKSEYEKTSRLKEAKDITKEEILSARMKSSVVGFGGSGIPTYKKYSSDYPIDSLIINAMECAPYLTSDTSFGPSWIEEAFLSLPYLLKASGARKAYYCVNKKNDALISCCIRRQKKYPRLPVELVLVKDRYPMGYERNLVSYVLKRSYSELPLEAGCIVDNLFTYIRLGRYFTSGKTPDRRCVTLSGDRDNSRNVLVPIGTNAKDLLSYCGYVPSADDRIISGSPICGKEREDACFARLPYDNCITVLKRKKRESEPCLRCGRCYYGCPRHLQPVQIGRAYKAMDVERRSELKADSCIGCNLCSYQCPSRIDISQRVLKAKKRVLNSKKEMK